MDTKYHVPHFFLKNFLFAHRSKFPITKVIEIFLPQICNFFNKIV